MDKMVLLGGDGGSAAAVAAVAGDYDDDDVGDDAEDVDDDVDVEPEIQYKLMEQLGPHIWGEEMLEENHSQPPAAVMDPILSG